MKKLSSTFLTSGLRLLIILSLGVVGTAFADGKKVLRYDVLQDGATFFAIAQDGFDDFTFANGAGFSIQGWIYPAGTFDKDFVPDLVNGMPPFQDKILGRWSCRGLFVKDISESGIQLVGSQVWIFGPLDGRRGRKTLMTDGIDLSAEATDFNIPFKRAITGGTGPFAGASGEQISTNYGFSPNFTSFASTHKLIIDNDDDSDSDSDSD